MDGEIKQGVQRSRGIFIHAEDEGADDDNTAMAGDLQRLIVADADRVPTFVDLLEVGDISFEAVMFDILQYSLPKLPFLIAIVTE